MMASPRTMIARKKTEEDFSDDEFTEENDDPDFHNISVKLRRLRGELYIKSESGVDVHQEIFEYQNQGKNFTKRFSETLSGRVHVIWEKRSKLQSKMYMKTCKRLDPILTARTR